MEHLANRLRLFKEVNDGALVFNDIDYSVITGGFAHKFNRRNDVDIITVLPYVDHDTIERICKFVRSHLRAQLQNGFVPDMQFPSDIITRQQMLNTVSGRAIEVRDGNILRLKEYSEDEIKNNPEADYRIWLYEMITHDFDLIRGSFESLVHDTRIALKTIFLYTSQLFDYREQVDLEKLRTDMFKSAGLNYKLCEKQCRYLVDIVENEKIGRLLSETISINREKLKSETERLVLSLGHPNLKMATHLVDWQRIRDEATLFIQEYGA